MEKPRRKGERKERKTERRPQKQGLRTTQRVLFTIKLHIATST